MCFSSESDTCLCVCVCVCMCLQGVVWEKERERQRESKQERADVNSSLMAVLVVILTHQTVKQSWLNGLLGASELLPVTVWLQRQPQGHIVRWPAFLPRHVYSWTHTHTQVQQHTYTHTHTHTHTHTQMHMLTIKHFKKAMEKSASMNLTGAKGNSLSLTKYFL